MKTGTGSSLRVISPMLLVGVMLISYSSNVVSEENLELDSLVGTWKIVETTVESREGVTVDDNPPPGMYIFTNRFMSNHIVPEWEPRPVITKDSSDEDRLGAFSNFIADGGEYWIEGDIIQTHNFVAKNPIGMRSEQKRGNGIQYRFRFDKNDLVITMTNQGWASNGSVTYRLERME